MFFRLGEHYASAVAASARCATSRAMLLDPPPCRIGRKFGAGMAQARPFELARFANNGRLTTVVTGHHKLLVLRLGVAWLPLRYRNIALIRLHDPLRVAQRIVRHIVRLHDILQPLRI